MEINKYKKSQMGNFKGRQIHAIKNGKKCVMSPNEFYAKNESVANDDVDLDMDWYLENGYMRLEDFEKKMQECDNNK